MSGLSTPFASAGSAMPILGLLVPSTSARSTRSTKPISNLSA